MPKKSARIGCQVVKEATDLLFLPDTPRQPLLAAQCLELFELCLDSNPGGGNVRMETKPSSHRFALIPIPAAATFLRVRMRWRCSFALIPIPAAATFDAKRDAFNRSFALIPIPAAAT